MDLRIVCSCTYMYVLSYNISISRKINDEIVSNNIFAALVENWDLLTIEQLEWATIGLLEWFISGTLEWFTIGFLERFPLEHLE